MASFRKRGDTWRAEVVKRGVRESASFRTKAQAQAWATQIEAEIEARARGQIVRRTLRQAMDRLREQARRRDATRLVFLAESLGFADKWLEDVTPADFSVWRDRQLLGLKPSSVNRDLNMMQGLFTRCIEWGWLHKNPLSGFKRPKDPPPRDRLISWREIRAVLRALGWQRKPPETLQQEVGYAFLMSLHTGMRAGEVLSYELRGSVAHLPKTKNGDSRDVPLGRRALRLHALCHPFKLNTASLDALFRKARKRAGLEGFTFHDARATALTRLSSKVDALTLARISGHRDLKTLLDHYYRTTPEQIAQGLR